MERAQPGEGRERNEGGCSGRSCKVQASIRITPGSKVWYGI